MDHLKPRFEKAIDHVKSQLATFRTGRANPAILNKVQVDYYGSMVPLQQVASISVPENTMLVLNVFDQNAVASVEKAIQTSDLNLNPQTEGAVIRLRLPELTEDRRKDLVKLVRKEGEEGKVSIRNLRRDEIDRLKAEEKNKEISEDDLKKAQDDVQKLVDQYTGVIDGLIKDKESEIMTI